MAEIRSRWDLRRFGTQETTSKNQVGPLSALTLGGPDPQLIGGVMEKMWAKYTVQYVA